MGEIQFHAVPVIAFEKVHFVVDIMRLDAGRHPGVGGIIIDPIRAKIVGENIAGRPLGEQQRRADVIKNVVFNQTRAGQLQIDAVGAPP